MAHKNKKAQKINITQRKMRNICLQIINAAQKMSYLERDEKNQKNSRIYIEDDALKYMVYVYTDKAFGIKSNTKKHWQNVFKKNKQKTGNLETTSKKVSELIGGKEQCPLPLEVIPNYMGINLCSVDDITWQKQADGQLTSLSIKFIPDNQGT